MYTLYSTIVTMLVHNVIDSIKGNFSSCSAILKSKSFKVYLALEKYCTVAKIYTSRLTLKSVKPAVGKG